jgi:hypothetical protein
MGRDLFDTDQTWTKATAKAVVTSVGRMQKNEPEREVPGTEDSQALSMQKVPILRAQK